MFSPDHVPLPRSQWQWEALCRSCLCGPLSPRCSGCVIEKRSWPGFRRWRLFQWRGSHFSLYSGKRENIMRAACANCLREVGQAAMFAATDFKGYFPPSLAFLQDHRYLPQLPRCPSARSDAEPYFYCPWIADPNADLDGVYTSQIESMVQEVAQRFPEYTGRGWPIRLVNKDRLDGAVPIIACDFRNNHAGAGRNVLYADGTLKWMRESEFQTELRRDTNRWLAKALHAAENAH